MDTAINRISVYPVDKFGLAEVVTSQIKEFGVEYSSIIALFHPSSVSWEVFNFVIPTLSEQYHLQKTGIEVLGGVNGSKKRNDM